MQQCHAALTCLEAPDEYSRTREHDGRRIEEIDGGWRLLNHGKYRALLSAEERKEYNRRKQAEYRQSKNQADPAHVKDSCINVSKSVLNAHITESEADTESFNIVAKATHPAEVLEIFELWDLTFLPKRKTTASAKRITAAKARMKELDFRESWKEALCMIPTIPFLMGRNDRGWKADIDWFLKPDSVVKIIEGKYSNDPKSKHKGIQQPELIEKGF